MIQYFLQIKFTNRLIFIIPKEIFMKKQQSAEQLEIAETLADRLRTDPEFRKTVYSQTGGWALLKALADKFDIHLSFDDVPDPDHELSEKELAAVVGGFSCFELCVQQTGSPGECIVYCG
jgi:bacteriocin-like protein